MSEVEVSLRHRPPLVSVVTPAYNAMPYIKETVLSVRGQDYSRIEHIIMDGGSTDGTLEFLRQQPHLTWTSEADRGQSHALNKGFKQANGEIIGWLNADDLYEPGAITSAVQYLSENADVDIVYGDLLIIGESSEQIGLTRSQPFDVEDLLDSNFVKQPTVFMRKGVLDRFKGLDEQLHFTMDREFWLRAGIAGTRVHYLEGAILAKFRLCSGTKSFEDTPEFRLEWARVLEKIVSENSEESTFRLAAKRALKRTQAQYHMAKMSQALEQRNRSLTFSQLFLALQHDISLMLNRGTWKFAVMGILGLKPDRMRKFRKTNGARTRDNAKQP